MVLLGRLMHKITSRAYQLTRSPGVAFGLFGPAHVPTVWVCVCVSVISQVRVQRRRLIAIFSTAGAGPFSGTL